VTQTASTVAWRTSSVVSLWSGSTMESLALEGNKANWRPSVGSALGLTAAAACARFMGLKSVYVIAKREVINWRLDIVW
jgi:hypothetical protein